MKLRCFCISGKNEFSVDLKSKCKNPQYKSEGELILFYERNHKSKTIKNKRIFESKLYLLKTVEKQLSICCNSHDNAKSLNMNRSFTF